MSRKKLAIGDRVTVYRRGNPLYSSWISSMNYIVGLSGIILEIEDDDLFIQLDNEAHAWWFPKTTIKREVKP